MTRKAHGIVRNNTVVLDEDLPEMEGRRVEVELRVDAPQDELAPPTQLLEAWRAWVNSGDQGPIRDEPDAWA